MNALRFAAISALILAVGIATAGAADIRQVGYFKTSTGFRIFSLKMPDGATAKEIREHAQGLPYTAGSMTAAYFYAKDAKIPADGLTLAKGVFQANRVLYEMPGLSGWRFAFMKASDGSERFVDCEKEPNDALCHP